jgi:hypothetical protein
MKNIFSSNKYKFVILVSIVLLASSCALKPVTSEYNFVKIDLEDVNLDKLGNGNVLIYNGADILHKIDNTARLNIWIDNKALGQIKGREYVIINLKKGKHMFKALHIDVLKMRSTHDVEIDENTKVIKIKPNLTSNKLWITNELPKKFEKYKYAEKR